jgi:hypothetical protein
MQVGVIMDNDSHGAAAHQALRKISTQPGRSQRQALRSAVLGCEKRRVVRGGILERIPVEDYMTQAQHDEPALWGCGNRLYCISTYARLVHDTLR